MTNSAPPPLSLSIYMNVCRLYEKLLSADQRETAHEDEHARILTPRARSHLGCVKCCCLVLYVYSKHIKNRGQLLRTTGRTQEETSNYLSLSIHNVFD